MLLQFRSGTSTLLAILPGFIGVVLVAENQVLNVNYLPALATARYQTQAAGAAEWEKLKVMTAVHARYGEFNPPTLPAAPLVTWLHGPTDLTLRWVVCGLQLCATWPIYVGSPPSALVG